MVVWEEEGIIPTGNLNRAAKVWLTECPHHDQGAWRLVAKISRRRFNFEAAAIAATSLSSGAGALGASSHQEKPGSSPENVANLGLTAKQDREVDIKFSNAIREFGDRLSNEQRQRLRRILAYNEKMLASIRAFHVQNGDPPASVLKNFEDRSG